MAKSIDPSFLLNSPQVKDLYDVYHKLPRGNLCYYNANSVELFQEACRSARFHNHHDRDQDHNLTKLLNRSFILSRSTGLENLKLMLNTSDTTRLYSKVTAYKEAVAEFFSGVDVSSNAYADKVIKSTKKSLMDSIADFAKRDPSSLLFEVPAPDPKLVLSAQDRDPAVYSLGRFLNKQTALLCGMMDKIVRVPIFANTAVFDQIVLSPVPRAFADAGRNIVRQTQLAYKQYVNTRALAETEPTEITKLNLLSFEPNMTVEKGVKFISYCTDKPIEHADTITRIPQRLIHGYIERLESLRQNDGFDSASNRLAYVIGLLVSPILLLPFSVELLGFGLVFGLTAVAFGLDVIRLCFQCVLLVFTLPLAACDPVLAGHIMSFGGLFKQSLLSCVQELLNSHSISEYTLSPEEQLLLTTHSKKADNLIFLNSPATILVFMGHLRSLIGGWFAVEKTFVDLTTPEFLRIAVAANVIKSISDDATNAPATLDPSRLGHSPVKFLNEIFLGLMDDLIGPFRQNHPIPSTVGYAIAVVTLGLHVLPASVIAQMHAKSLAAALQISADWFAKSFMGHGHLVADPLNEFFALLLEWKAGVLTPEFIANLVDGRSMTTDMVRNFDVYFTVLAVGMASGYAFGMIPEIKSVYGLLINILIEEAKIAHHGVMPFTAIEYTFIMGKLGFLFYTLVELDATAAKLRIDSYIKYIQCNDDNESSGLLADLQLNDDDRMKIILVRTTYQDKKLAQTWLEALRSNGLDQVMHALSWSRRKELYNELCLEDISDEIRHAFFNRYVRREYPALFRLPIGLSLYLLWPVRELYRFIVLELYREDPAVIKSIEMERAVDCVLFDDWFGILRRVGDQLLQMTLQTVIMLGVVMPLVVLYAGICFLPWLCGVYKNYDPIMLGQMIEFSLTSGHFEENSHAATAQNAHIGNNYCDVQSLALAHRI